MSVPEQNPNTLNVLLGGIQRRFSRMTSGQDDGQKNISHLSKYRGDRWVGQIDKILYIRFWRVTGQTYRVLESQTITKGLLGKVMGL